MLLLIPRVMTEIAFSIMWSAFNQNHFVTTPTEAPTELNPTHEQEIVV